LLLIVEAVPASASASTLPAAQGIIDILLNGRVGAFHNFFLPALKKICYRKVVEKFSS